MWETYYTACNLNQALEILNHRPNESKIIAGGTDLVLELKKGLHSNVKALIDINRIANFDEIRVKDEFIYINPLVTHNHALVSKPLKLFALPLVKACQSIGAPQIRNIGTIIGNVVTASPANDTISPLYAMDAELQIQSKFEKRWVRISDFYLGVRSTILKNNEIVSAIRIRKMRPEQKGSFIKFLLRNSHGISVANASVILGFDKNIINHAKIALGAVAPTIIRVTEAEELLIGKELNQEILDEVKKICVEAISPISDIRSSKDYRNHLISYLISKAIEDIQSDKWNDFPEKPVLLWGKTHAKQKRLINSVVHSNETPIRTKINGKEYSIISGQDNTLINLVREEAGLTGSKLGCGEGECGACTLFLNGLPVLSCLVPAPRAHDSEITTIEGISQGNKLHPVQQAFIEEGAVQCGYCTPGFIMSSVKLLEENTNPTYTEIQEGLAGNICRCTGYYSIIKAVEKAAQMLK